MKICFFTGTRAEYGLLSSLMKLTADDSMTKLQLVVTGAHLCREYGFTWKQIEADGFSIDAKADILKFGDDRKGVLKSVGLACQLFADILEKLSPDMAVILGDRYEMLAAAQACFFMNIPVAHLYGGDVTEGAFDDSIRHSVTKLSRLHFTATENSRKRVISMGEQPETVFNAGALGIELLKSLKLLSGSEIRNFLGVGEGCDYFMISCHPETNDSADVGERYAMVLSAVLEITEQTGAKAVFTGANADPGGMLINSMTEDFVKKNEKNACFFMSLGQLRYVSAVKHCACVIGNSSSGIVEVPSLGICSINIGDRQKGRERAESVTDCGWNTEMIADAACDIINRKIKAEGVFNPYEKENTAAFIFQQIKKHVDIAKLPKKFYDITDEDIFRYKP